MGKLSEEVKLPPTTQIRVKVLNIIALVILLLAIYIEIFYRKGIVQGASVRLDTSSCIFASVFKLSFKMSKCKLFFSRYWF